MDEAGYVPLEARGVVALGGPEARPFLQGLISNDLDIAGITLGDTTLDFGRASAALVLKF